MKGSAAKPKSALVTFLLCLFFGILGAHRFYVGKFGTGLLMLFTAGGLGFWVLIDLIFIINNKFEDVNGNTLILTQHPSTLKLALMVVGTIVAWFMIFFAVMITVTLFATRELVDTVNDQLAALRAGDIHKAYSYTSQDFQNITPITQFKEFVDEYAALSENESAAFATREIEENKGMLKGTLTAKNGVKTPVKFYLVKEEGEWKILGINLSPVAALIKLNRKPPEAEIKKIFSAPVLTKTYENKNNKYSIKYPQNWEYESPGAGVVIFSGAQGTRSYYSTVNIQAILAKKSGGKYADVKDFMRDLKKQIAEKTVDGKIISEGVINLPKNPKKFQGEFIIFTYNHKGQIFKQMQVVMTRSDGAFYYAWAYTAPIEIYEENAPISKAMLESWNIQ